MRKIKYMLKCLKSLNVKNMFNIINKLSKKIHKSKIILTIDIIYCALKYGAGYYDYQEFEFYNLTNKERKTYLTRVKNNNIIKTYNKKEDFYKLDDKGVFNEIFKGYEHDSTAHTYVDLLTTEGCVINLNNMFSYENWSRQ